jgi:hypothetical protein
MDCSRCQHLLVAYEHAVKQYTTAVQSIPKVAEADRQPVWGEGEQLRRACLDAENALKEHWRREHCNLAAKAMAS